MDDSSPCTKLCKLDPETGLCLGCRRSRAEIAGWRCMTPAERIRVKQNLPARRAEASAHAKSR